MGKRGITGIFELDNLYGRRVAIRPYLGQEKLLLGSYTLHEVNGNDAPVYGKALAHIKAAVGLKDCRAHINHRALKQIREGRAKFPAMAIVATLMHIDDVPARDWADVKFNPHRDSEMRIGETPWNGHRPMVVAMPGNGFVAERQG